LRTPLPLIGNITCAARVPAHNNGCRQMAKILDPSGYRLTLFRVTQVGSDSLYSILP